MNIPRIETKRLILRGFEEKDLDAYAEMCSDHDVMRYIGTGITLSRVESWRNMAMIMGHWYLRGYGLWAVEERQTGEMIGRIGCWEPEGWVAFEVGWMLRKASWGKGFATEAATAAMDYAFKNLHQSRVISLILPENLLSQRLALRLGEKLEGTTKILGNQVRIYGISQEEWQAIKSQK